MEGFQALLVVCTGTRPSDESCTEVVHVGDKKAEAKSGAGMGSLPATLPRGISVFVETEILECLAKAYQGAGEEEAALSLLERSLALSQELQREKVAKGLMR